MQVYDRYLYERYVFVRGKDQDCHGRCEFFGEDLVLFYSDLDMQARFFQFFGMVGERRHGVWSNENSNGVMFSGRARSGKGMITCKHKNGNDSSRQFISVGHDLQSCTRVECLLETSRQSLFFPVITQSQSNVNIAFYPNVNIGMYCNVIIENGQCFNFSSSRQLFQVFTLYKFNVYIEMMTIYSLQYTEFQCKHWMLSMLSQEEQCQTCCKHCRLPM